MNDFSSEIVYLKDVLNDQRSEISTLQKKVVSGNQATNGSATADNCFAPPTNENSGIAGSNRKSEAAAAYDRPSHSVAERRKTSESLLSRDDDQEDLKGQDFGGRIEMQEESAGMAAKSLTQGEGLAALEEQVHESVKKRRTEQSDEVNSILSNSMAIKQGEYQYWGADEDVLETPKSIPKSLAESVNSKISAVAQQRSPPIEALEMDIDDDRCPVCLDSPFGLMVLCSGCRYALHSACAKKSGGGATGMSLRMKCLFASTAVYLLTYLALAQVKILNVPSAPRQGASIANMTAWHGFHVLVDG